MQVDFYHLTHRPLDRVLPQIAQKVVADGERLLVVAAAEEQRRHLDRLLWSYAPDSFLPHAVAGDGDDAAQPVLIAAEPVAANAARHVALADGAWRAEALGFDRAFLFFDDDAVVPARAAWRDLAEREGVERRYWKQNDAGKWEQVA